VKKRNLRLLSGLLALSLLAAACGDDDSTDADDTSTTAADPEANVESTAQVSLDDACEEAKDAGVEAPEDFTVRLVTDIGKVDDRTFNQYAYEGMIAAAECFGFETSFIETVSEADYAKNISTSLEGGPDALVTTGFKLQAATLEAANQNPETNFIGIDQFHTEFPENYVSILFNEDEGGYMAGVLAASLTETDVIGVVAGDETVPPVVKLVNGYKAGALSVNPEITVLQDYNASFNDPAGGESVAGQFMGEGADVIFGAGGKTGSAGVVAATKAGAWGIGVDQDEYFSTFNGGSAPGADRLASSAVKRVDLGVFTEIVAILDGSFEGGIFALTAANSGITYAPFHDADIPDDVAAKLEETRKGLADGSIKTGLDPATGEPLAG
jgi:basic membrane lipoprotein Med (substrate-binding protein (PBP1-ABC) superfamily)